MNHELSALTMLRRAVKNCNTIGPDTAARLVKQVDAIVASDRQANSDLEEIYGYIGQLEDAAGHMCLCPRGTPSHVGHFLGALAEAWPLLMGAKERRFMDALNDLAVMLKENGCDCGGEAADSDHSYASAPCVAHQWIEKQAKLYRGLPAA